MSAPVTETPVQAILKQVEALPFDQLVVLNAQVADRVRRESKKAVRKPKKIRDPNAPKKERNAGMLAWEAYADKIQKENPKRFDGIKKVAEKMKIIKEEYKLKNVQQYNTFVEKFKASHVAKTAVATAPVVVAVKEEAKPVATTTAAKTTKKASK
jgi:hypothetical protein